MTFLACAGSKSDWQQPENSQAGTRKMVGYLHDGRIGWFQRRKANQPTSRLADTASADGSFHVRGIAVCASGGDVLGALKDRKAIAAGRIGIGGVSTGIGILKVEETHAMLKAIACWSPEPGRRRWRLLSSHRASTSSVMQPLQIKATASQRTAGSFDSRPFGFC